VTAIGRGVNDAKRQRGLGRKHSTPGSGAAANAGGAVPCRGGERRGLGSDTEERVMR
jgi:hypothetical protein